MKVEAMGRSSAGMKASHSAVKKAVVTVSHWAAVKGMKTVVS